MMTFLEDYHDVTLVSRTGGGDLVAFEVLVHRYQRVLFTVALGMIGDADEAHEATRAALVRTYRALSMLTDPELQACGFFSLAHRLLVHECLDLLNSEAWQTERMLFAEDDVHHSVPFRSVSFDERRQRVCAAVLRLCPEFRTVTVLRHLAGFTYDEIAVTLQLPVQVVRLRLHAARQQIGEWLLAWPSGLTLREEEEALLQGAIDGALEFKERESYDLLVASHATMALRAAALRELGQFLNSLGPAEPPVDLALEVMSEVASSTGFSRVAEATRR